MSVIIAPGIDMVDWPHTEDKFSEEDFLAFLVVAGPPPAEGNTHYRTAILHKRMDYIGMADKFCESYFGEPGSETTYEEGADYIGFYGKFLEWYACKQAIAQPDPTLFIESDVCIYKWRTKHERKN